MVQQMFAQDLAAIDNEDEREARRQGINKLTSEKYFEDNLQHARNAAARGDMTSARQHLNKAMQTDSVAGELNKLSADLTTNEEQYKSAIDKMCAQMLSDVDDEKQKEALRQEISKLANDMYFEANLEHALQAAEKVDFETARQYMGRSRQAHGVDRFDGGRLQKVRDDEIGVKVPSERMQAIDEAIAEASAAYGVDADLIKAIIWTESNFDPNAKSSKNAHGLMQLRDEAAKEVGIQNSFNIKQNVMGGTKYLKSLIDIYDGDIRLALLAYNWGKGNVKEWLRGKANPKDEAIGYLAKILDVDVDSIHKLENTQLDRYLKTWDRIKNLQDNAQD